MDKKKKHVDVAKFTLNRYHNIEISMVGAPCSVIKDTVLKILDHIVEYRILYLEARHSEEKEERFEMTLPRDTNHAISVLGDLVKETYDGNNYSLDEKIEAQNYDAVILNGNHFAAAKQVVFLYPGKEQSLIRRIEELTNVFLLVDCGAGSLPKEVLEKYPHYADIEKISIDKIESITSFVLDELKNSIDRPLYGLVLTGGKSSRMGKSKANLNYYGKPQWKHTYELLSTLCEKVFVSVAEKTDLDGHDEEGLIPDQFIELGPLGGILTAFKKYPNASFLVLACDLPMVDKELLHELISHRDFSAIATSFKGDNRDGFPEPLIAIWEPKAYPRILQFLAMGYSCPRKVMINSKTKTIPAPDIRKLSNANTPEEFEALSKEIKHLH